MSSYHSFREEKGKIDRVNQLSLLKSILKRSIHKTQASKMHDILSHHLISLKKRSLAQVVHNLDYLDNMSSRVTMFQHRRDNRGKQKVINTLLAYLQKRQQKDKKKMLLSTYRGDREGHSLAYCFHKLTLHREHKKRVAMRKEEIMGL